MRMRKSYQAGTVQLKKRQTGPDVWVYRWRDPNGKRRSQIIGSTRNLTTKASAMKAAEPFRAAGTEGPAPTKIATFGALIDLYIEKECPQRFSTRRTYILYLDRFIRARWGDYRIEDINPPQAVKDWLLSLDVASKTAGHIKALMSGLFKFAICSGLLEMGKNPISAFELKGTTIREKEPRSLTVEEFQRFVQHLEQPFDTIALTCACLGLRISECMALRWSDVDWLSGVLNVKRGIVSGREGDVKTRGSRKPMPIDRGLLAKLEAWRQTTEFSASEDFIFASPMKAGALPWSSAWVWTVYQKAATSAGIGKLGTHTMRHSYRTWMQTSGAPIAVQQKLMRHADIRTTMNTYGDMPTSEMAEANSKVVEMVLNRKVV
jgi:integrase